MDDQRSVMATQRGVVRRAQLLEAGLTPADVRRMLRRRELVTIVPGVYVDHTGELTWDQHRWAGVLALWPAALSHRSALEPDDAGHEVVRRGLLHVAVDRQRSVAAPPGVRVHRLASFDDVVQWNRSPPRVRLETALIEVAAGADDEMRAIALLADAVQARRTTPARLREALAAAPRVRRRDLIAGVLGDLEHGVCSALEYGYLTRVERPHGLPTGLRQVADDGIDRDVEYAGQRVIIELGGRAFHDDAASRDRDLDRDLAAAARGRHTLRLGWGQVYGRGRSCASARLIAEVLRRRGWVGKLRRRPECPGVGEEAVPRVA